MVDFFRSSSDAQEIGCGGMQQDMVGASDDILLSNFVEPTSERWRIRERNQK